MSGKSKSNEITAIPILLDKPDLKGCVVTIDAMGCQKEIAEKVIKKKGDYILQVKDNQSSLKEQVEKLFKRQVAKNEHVDYDLGHGMSERRICRVIDDIAF